MSRLREAAEEYLAMRRALGFTLTTQARQLMRFVDYCEAHHAERITTDLALSWARQTPHSSDEVYRSTRLTVVRIFARHLKTLDPATEIPPADILPHPIRRSVPYLFSPGEITALMNAAGRLSPPLRAATWQTLIGLLAVTGMRKSSGLPPRSRPRRPGRRGAGDRGLEVRQVSSTVPAPLDRHRVVGLRTPP